MEDIESLMPDKLMDTIKELEEMTIETLNKYPRHDKNIGFRFKNDVTEFSATCCATS